MNSDLDRQLSAPAERDLPDGRHRLLREQLMRETRTSKRSVRTRVAISAAIAGTTAVLVGGAFVASQAIGAAPNTSPAKTATQFTAGSASGLLLQMAAYNEALPAVQTAHKGQWVYVKTEGKYANASAPALSAAPNGKAPGPARVDGNSRGPVGPLSALEQREVWLPVDPHSAVRPLVHEHGYYTEIYGSSNNPITQAEEGNYQAIAALPTDPDALLKLITAERRSEKGNQPANVRDELVFHAIESILSESIVPPKVAAALYRAAAKMPGMTVVPDVTDAAGRHGVGVSVVGDGVVYDGSIRDTMIFDKKTFSYLGSTSVLAKDGTGGKAGTVTRVTAVLTRSIVDQRPQVKLETK
jgi:hypothetical protein